MKWGVLFLGVLVIRALLLGVYIGALIFGKSHIDMHIHVYVGYT